MNNRTVKNIVPKCGTDTVLPFLLVFVFYVILHGHLSPGGGFQGGVLAVAAVVLIYLAYGYKATRQALCPEFLRRTEGLAVTLYIALAMIGVVAGAQFCENVIFNNGHIGSIHSAGTIALMDEAVGLNVLTGVSVLAISMLGLLIVDDEKE